PQSLKSVGSTICFVTGIERVNIQRELPNQIVRPFGIPTVRCFSMQDHLLPTDMPNEPIPGYRLLRQCGKGGFGEVWEAVGPGGLRVALKLVPLGGKVGESELRALELIKGIRHAHLLAMFGAWQVAGRLIIAVELAEGTLFDRLRECNGQER